MTEAMKDTMRYLLLLFLIPAVLNAGARQITPDEASEIACEFFTSSSTSIKSVSVKRIGAKATVNDESRPYYIFNAEGNPGFVVVSGDSRVRKILAYSHTVNFDYNNLPPQLADLLNRYDEQITSLRSNDVVHPSWNQVMRADNVSGGKLLETAQWGQGAPYNSKCPVSDGVQSPTGCVATAMAIIMKYHNWPEQGRKQHTYWNYTTGAEYTTDFSKFKPQWDKMLPSYNAGAYAVENADAVAELMYYAGMSANMQYSATESGAGVLGVMTALRRYFSYTSKMDEVIMEQFGQDEWKTRVRKDIDDDCPVFYYGQGTGAHAFVIDGYDEKDLFHVNWGWNGMANGYFALDDLSPDGQYYSENPGMVAGIRPAAADDAVWSDFFMADEKYIGTPGIIKSMNPSVENIVRDEPFTVAVPPVAFPPQVECDLGIAIVDENNSIKQVLASRAYSATYEFLSYAGTTFGGIIPKCKIDDTDKLQLVVKEHGESRWLLVNDSKDIKSSIGVKDNVPYTANVHWDVDPRFGVEFLEMDQWSGNVISSEEINNAVGKLLVGAEYQFHPFEADANRGIYSAVRINDVMADICVNKAFTMGDRAIGVINVAPGEYDIKIFGLFPGDEQSAEFKIENPGDLQRYVSDKECGHITGFTLSGGGSEQDYASICLNMPFIARLDLSAYDPVKEKLPDFCFAGLPNLSKVILPENVVNIGDGCFIGDALESVVIPESVKYIGTQAFNNYEGYFDALNLAAVFCKATTPPEVGEIPFGNNSRTILYVLPGCKEAYASHSYWSTFKEIIEDPNPAIDIEEVIVDGIRYKVYPNYAEIVGPEKDNCPDEVIFQESVISGGRTVPVTSIAYHAFLYTSIKKVTVPASVINWATSTFSCCYELTDVVIEAPIKELPTNTFENCVSLTNISLPNTIEVIGQYAISAAGNIKRFDVPASLQEIQWNGIIALHELEEIILPEENNNFNLIDGVLYSKDMKWLYLYPSGDRSRERFVILEGVTNTFILSISGENLKEVVIPNSMTDLTEQFIYGVPNLETLILHDEITEVPNDCFWLPKNLTLGKKLFKIGSQYMAQYSCNIYCLNELNLTDFHIISNGFPGTINLCSGYLTPNVIFSDNINKDQNYTVDIPGKADWSECNLDSENIRHMWNYRFNKEQQEFSISDVLQNVEITDVKINGKSAGNGAGIYCYTDTDVPEVIVEYRVNDHQDMTTVYSSEFNRNLPIEDCSAIIDINTDPSETVYEVYTLSGICVAHNTTKGLSPGIYILKTSNSTRKLIIR